jgi:stearoyl-CoA desaturase (Delta-9 desaturase)
VRICVLHHITWSINSVCHTFGRRPFRTGDRSSNVAALSVVSFGESWHNAHHAFPAMARHGVDRHQLDSSAALIGFCERRGWASAVRWPDPVRLDARRKRQFPKPISGVR